MNRMNEARLQKTLDKQIRTSDYGIVTYREMVTRRLQEGATLKAADVTDETALRAAKRELESMRRSNGWVPIGNPNHPRTIRYNELRKIVASGPATKKEYRLMNTDGSFSVLPKFVFDYFANQS